MCGRKRSNTDRLPENEKKKKKEEEET